MTFLAPRGSAVSLLLACVTGFTLAGGCGSGDQKRIQGDAGAGGAPEGGSANSGGSEAAPGGAPSEASGGQAAGQGGQMPAAEAGAPGAAGETAEAGNGGSGAGGAPPVDVCTLDGSVSGLALESEPIYQGCRGALMRVPFAALDASALFTCCASSTSVPSFGLPLTGAFDFDGGGQFELVVPQTAPFGTYALDLSCPTQPNDHSFAIEINDAPAPVVHSVNAEIAVAESMFIEGEHLDTVTSIGAFRLADGSYFECIFELADRKATSVACAFDDIPSSATRDDYFQIDVANQTCGSAADGPLFLVSPPPL